MALLPPRDLEGADLSDFREELVQSLSSACEHAADYSVDLSTQRDAQPEVTAAPRYSFRNLAYIQEATAASSCADCWFD